MLYDTAWNPPAQHRAGRSFAGPDVQGAKFKDDFLAGWTEASSDIRIISLRFCIDADQTVVCTFTAMGAHDRPLRPLPATGTQFALPQGEMWRFDSSGRVVGGDVYFDRVPLLTQLVLMPQPPGASAVSQPEGERQIALSARLR